jgi:Ca-activated chloride channel family protein
MKAFREGYMKRAPLFRAWLLFASACVLVSGCEQSSTANTKTAESSPRVSFKPKPVPKPPEPDAMLIPDGERLTVLRFDREEMGDVQDGDRVDILGVFTIPPEELNSVDPTNEQILSLDRGELQLHVAMPLLQNVRAHKRRCEEDACFVSFFVTRDEDSLISLSDSRGALSLARRSESDTTMQAISKRTLKEALVDIDVLQERRRENLGKGMLHGKRKQIIDDERNRTCEFNNRIGKISVGEGERAATFAFADHRQELVKLQPGDWLDISGVFRTRIEPSDGNRSNEIIDIELLQRVRVIHAEANRVTLLLTGDEIRLLRLAQRGGRIRYTLRRLDDEKNAPLAKHTLKSMLADLELLHSQRVKRCKTKNCHQGQLAINNKGTGQNKTASKARAPRRAYNVDSSDGSSTFSLDVDAGAYTRMREIVNKNNLPKRNEVRVEEYLNYFDWNLPRPPSEQKLGITLEATPDPMVPAELHDVRRVVRVGIKARELAAGERKPAHLTFLVDTSGSMLEDGRLSKVKNALKVLVSNLGEKDTVSLVTYAGSARIALEHTGLNQRKALIDAINKLQADGATAMQSGLTYAYQSAARGFVEGDINRVIVLSDGNANVGAADHLPMLATVQSQIEKGITISTIGVGDQGYRDELMERLADKGDGNHYFIDSYDEIHRVFLEQIDGTLQLVARDARVKVTFDKSKVSTHRLIGYENRALKKGDFEDDAVDAGEVGAGHEVTALYAVSLLPGQTIDGALSVSLRYRDEEDGEPRQLERALEPGDIHSLEDASKDHRFALGVVAFAEILRDSEAGKKLYFQPFYDLMMEGEGAHYIESDPRKLEFIELYTKVWGMIGCGQP